MIHELQLDYEGFIRRATIRGGLRQGIETATNYYQKLQALKKYYSQVDEDIIKAFKVSKFRWQNTYPYDWSRILTPIEFQAWQAIRSKGRIVLYPQYPVLNYYLDFANPGLKIGLELDGKQYHNKERDVIRDAELKNAGWVIYRITGKEMMRSNFKELYEIQELLRYDEAHYDDLRYWLLETGDGVIEAIKAFHFEDLDKKYSYSDNELSRDYINLCRQTLELHQY
jgi:very-short-patch-repair endonuclease